MSQVVHVIGAPGAGKTVLRRALATALSVPGLSIDDERRRLMGPDDVWPADDRIAWSRLRAAIAVHDPCIVETSGLSPKDRPLLAGHVVYRVLVRADRESRLRRLRARVRAGDALARTPDYVVRVGRLGEPTIRVNAVWDGETPRPVAPLVAKVQAWLRPVSVAI